MRVTTWNVLHRIHAVNWKEAPIAAFPDERVRTGAIAQTIAGWLTGGVDVVCLQEVSGDQLARLREAIEPEVSVHAHLYPRVPRLRDGSPSPLEVPNEHLVMLVKRLPASLREAKTFESDPGKGLVAVDVGDDLIVVSTHVSSGSRSAAQLAQILRSVQDEHRGAAVLGDFNTSAADVRAALGEGFTLADVAGPTRIATAEHAAKTIDHVAARGARIVSAEVLDGRGLSDHHPVTAEITLG